MVLENPCFSVGNLHSPELHKGIIWIRISTKKPLEALVYFLAGKF